MCRGTGQTSSSGSAECAFRLRLLVKRSLVAPFKQFDGLFLSTSVQSTFLSVRYRKQAGLCVHTRGSSGCPGCGLHSSGRFGRVIQGWVKLEVTPGSKQHCDFGMVV